MKPHRFLTGALLLAAVYASAQSKKPACSCPDGNIAGTFGIGHQHIFVVCGSKDATTFKGRTVFSEFSLSLCGAAQPLNRWGADQLCQIHIKADTLLVEELVSLPAGSAATEQLVLWRTDHIYFTRGKVTQRMSINRDLPRFTPGQIAATLASYGKTPNVNNEQTIPKVEIHLVIQIA
ncbi:hypothetical protein [Mucilaginibacter jinjuensis]|uniref:YceI-like domain-containing protein n=1 Tax=Mucilaginibacter jinjuensis TaxID=1176721 RepID=A0ABY7TDY8_9SPHI|nr:hypothetical protein [Mucilaginibacter jinjuensis]WCT14241.1 hypothetical protein PQO05_09880 [Mucilaginibacter jinjuensis]